MAFVRVKGLKYSAASAKTPRHVRANLHALLQVSADGEVKLYGACVQRGITMLSIAHRPALKQFHSTIVHFDGSQAGQGWSIESIDKKDTDEKTNA